MASIEPDTIKNMNDTSTMDVTESILEDSFAAEGDQEMKQNWNFFFMFMAYAIACVASYSAVHMMDHALWRAEELKKATIIKYPDLYAAFMLGFGAVWSMHFVGMAAVTLDDTPICYDWGITMGSLAAVLAMMYAAIKVARHDVFATPERATVLNEIVGHNYVSEKEALWALTRITYFHKLHHLGLASFLAGSGAIVMHYTGMMAQRGPIRKEWSYTLVATSIVLAIIICFAGFWIIFRLRWKIKQIWLRCVSAGVIALAVCFLHFFGMLSVRYYPDNSPSAHMCQSTYDAHNSSPNAWTLHQMIVLGVGVFVPILAFYISNVINQELIIAYEITARSNAMVSSMFPGKIRDRLFAADEKTKLKTFLKDDMDDSRNMVNEIDSKPIADLFPETTIMFADIAGFTSWSSEREPCQVFTLLETIYHAFDEISERHGVFKVETVGDCYVAVCGLPDARPDHAVVMARAATRYVYKMNVLTKRLEVKLGPDTGDLNIRIGLHSGPVTAGVLRGANARFQLFGDTMNTASRMESTGLPGRVQVSAETVELLKAAGHDGWVKPRDKLVAAKGKGELQTYWLNVTNLASGSTGSTNSLGELSSSVSDDKILRLVEWNVEILLRLLKLIVATRNARTGSRYLVPVNENLLLSQDGETVIDEVRDVIDLPAFQNKRQVDPNSVHLPDEVVTQLRGFVSCLALRYRENAFHNFEHASHVTMSVSKLLSRIVNNSSDQPLPEEQCVYSTLHDHTYGITSDPLTQFACILSALIHDVDHQGVPNSQLIKENTPVSLLYKNRSVAEQNSMDIAWGIFMEDKYKELRSTIYSSEEEMKRFRQLMVNSVMATDIMDKDISAQRNARWKKAFFAAEETTEDQLVATNRKATIVMEHIIQASDVAHTMQHWIVYSKWNERLFQEMHTAYKKGRADKDPSEFWYQGELGFFDFYVIPLAKKLKDCGVFGAASDEYLNYATQNRKEWEQKGEDIVKQYVENLRGGPGCSDTEVTGESSVIREIDASGHASLFLDEGGDVMV